MNRSSSVLLLLAGLCQPGVAGGAAVPPQDVTVLKIATLAPEGSAWMRCFAEWQGALAAHSGGRLKIVFQPGGRAGDEKDMVRKMGIGQLAGAAVTSIGLGLIQSQVRVLELPMLIRSYEQLDCVRDRLDDELRKLLEDRGYLLLAWGDVGPVHLFSNIPLYSLADLKRTRTWLWTDDPLTRALYQELGLSGVPLGVPQVLPELQTGMIDAYYGSPLSVVALQWHTRARYMSALRLSFAVGATVMHRRAFDALGPELRQVVRDDSQRLQARLLGQLRRDNDEALAALKKDGIQVIPPSPQLIQQITQAATAVRGKLEPSLYTPALRQRVEGLLAGECR